MDWFLYGRDLRHVVVSISLNFNGAGIRGTLTEILLCTANSNNVTGLCVSDEAFYFISNSIVLRCC